MWCWSCWTLPRPTAGQFRRHHRRLDRRAGRRPRRSSAPAPLLGVIPDTSRDIDTVRSDAAGCRAAADALMKLRRADRQRRDRPRHRLRHRPPQGRARHGVRRVPGRAVQRRGFHPRRGSPGAVAVVARPETAVEGAVHIAGRGAAARLRPARRQILPALPGDDRRGHRHQRQDLDRRAGPPALADGRAPARRASARWASPPPTTR